MAPDPHTAVKQELLVRYLDYWVPAALHAARSATYLDGSGYGPAAALRVIVEFADLLAGRELAVLVEREPPAAPALPGLRVGPLPDDPPALVRAAGRSPVLAHLDGPAVTDPAVTDLAAALAAASDGELLLVTDPQPGDPREELYRAGFAYVVAVELVDRAGTAQLLRFATSADHSLERFKDELWAVDAYAGIRYRDPAEPDAIPLDISYEPHPGGLRRALLAYLAESTQVEPGQAESAHGAARTVAELRRFALTRTLYRPADVPRALGPLLSRGAVVREPARGRLTAATRVRLAG